MSATNLTQTKNYNEDGGNVALDDIVVTDADVNDVYTVSLTLSDTSTGSLTANDGATYTSGTGVWTITGDAATVNLALANVEFVPAADNNTDSHIDVLISDGNENGTVAVTGRIDLVVTAVNDAPVATTPAGPIAATEDQFVSIAGISFSDIDTGGADVTVTMNVADGTLTLDDTVVGGLGSGDIGGNGSGSVTLTGTISEINTTLAALNALQYRGTQDFFGSDTLSININDGGNTGVDPSTVGQPNTGGAADEQDNAAIVINVAADNDPPVLDLDANDTATTGADYETTFTEGGSPIAIADVDTAITDVDDANIESAVITLTNKQTGDALRRSIRTPPGQPALPPWSMRPPTS